jgi:hypothetical protein
VVATDVAAQGPVDGGRRPAARRPEDVDTVITTSYLIGDLAVDRIRTLHAEAARFALPVAAPRRPAPVRWWSRTPFRRPDPQPSRRDAPRTGGSRR